MVVVEVDGRRGEMVSDALELFPYKPYGIQEDFVRALVDIAMAGGEEGAAAIGIMESPTGTVWMSASASFAPPWPAQEGGRGAWALLTPAVVWSHVGQDDEPALWSLGLASCRPRCKRQWRWAWRCRWRPASRVGRRTGVA